MLSFKHNELPEKVVEIAPGQTEKFYFEYPTNTLRKWTGTMKYILTPWGKFKAPGINFHGLFKTEHVGLTMSCFFFVLIAEIFGIVQLYKEQFSGWIIILIIFSIYYCYDK